MAALVDPDGAGDTGVHAETSLSSLLAQTGMLTRRLLVRLVRNPITIAFALMLPVLFLLTLDVVLGDSIEAITGENGIYRSAPLMALVAAISGSAVGMVGIIGEQRDGFLNRLWVLPLHRGAGLLARLFAESIRLVATTVVILMVAVILGFRFREGTAAAALWLTVPVIFGIGFAFVVTTIALYWPKDLLVDAIQPVAGLGLALCTGLVPVDKYPEWIQPFVRYQPMSTAVDAMRGLSIGGPVLMPMLATLGWSLGIVAVCLWPIMVGYRKASTSR
jgi:ABC-2 type transport system permease protein